MWLSLFLNILILFDMFLLQCIVLAVHVRPVHHLQLRPMVNLIEEEEKEEDDDKHSRLFFSLNQIFY